MSDAIVKVRVVTTTPSVRSKVFKNNYNYIENEADLSDYYNKSQTDDIVDSSRRNAINNANANTELKINENNENYYTKSDIDSKLENINPSDVYTKSEIDAIQNNLETSIANKAPLENGKVPQAYLPSYVDDVVEVEYISQLTQGESGKIYLETETNKTYRWGETTFVEISSSLALGETSSTAYPGDKGKQNAADITTLKSRVATIASDLTTVTNQANSNTSNITYIQEAITAVYVELDSIKNNIPTFENLIV